ncbi:NAD(P)H-dependent oxidoreductase [Mycoplasma tullyi]|uniref:NAD(P)H-dependent oxidoreductase n=1 Tax=Mycoplasma tullyi TaxID=1612150 RepID=A0A7D7YKY1_9MOLU|nr:NAD(P)H-dependent oxidoreductase [Mycoplasma tullyi]QMT98741.1 NAD(P)H-dependent oxidoreductase [Mycoplasma tullyi]
MKTNTIVLSCSNSDVSKSINYDLASKIAKSGSFDLINLAEYDVPQVSSDTAGNVPAKMTELHEKLSSYDKVIFVTPEFNGYVPGFAKNILDWLSLNKEWLKNKKAYVVAATPGAKGAPMVRENLAEVLGFFGAEVAGSYGFAEYQLSQDRSKEIQEFLNTVNQ